jgi:Secretion system C-terminal sorting domain
LRLSDRYDLSRDVQIQVMDVSGRLVSEKRTTSTLENLELSRVSAGIYHIRIIQDSVIEVIKVVKI